MFKKSVPNKVRKCFEKVVKPPENVLKRFQQSSKHILKQIQESSEKGTENFKNNSKHINIKMSKRVPKRFRNKSYKTVLIFSMSKLDFLVYLMACTRLLMLFKVCYTCLIADLIKILCKEYTSVCFMCFAMTAVVASSTPVHTRLDARRVGVFLAG